MQLDSRARVTKARAQLVLDEPFYGLLSLRLVLREDPSCADMWTDAVTLGFNPQYVEKQTDLELRGLVAHVVTHIAAGHPWRQGDRDSARWNKAADRAINHLLVEAGFRLPAGSDLNFEHAGKPAELIYLELADERPDDEQPCGASPEGSSDDENGDSSDSGVSEGTTPEGNEPAEGANGSADGESLGHAPGEVRAAPDSMPEEEWTMAVQAAAQQQGTLPAGMQRLVDINRQARVDWKEALRNFVQVSVYSPDFSWSRPNRRWVHQGLYLPGLEGKSIRCMVVARDTSASIGDQYLAALNAELVDIIDACQPELVYVVDCDAAVAQVVLVENGDLPESLSAKGGGGTRFEPVFEWIAQEGIEPACVVYLTDLEGSFPASEPEYPVLWAVPEGHYSRRVAPFGETLSIDLD